MPASLTAASFGNELRLFADRSERVTGAVIDLATDIAEDSILDGSAITGAPGQPVQEGDLYRSWKRRRKSRWERSFTSNLPYAWGIENAIGPYGPLTLRSKVGGFHSLKQTVAAWPRIVAYAVRARS